MTTDLGTLALPVVAYLLGSIPTGYLLARGRGVDIRAVGSGNIGATNVSRALGKKLGVVVLLLDAAKGLLPVVIAGRVLGLAPEGIAVTGLAAVAGHMFSAFLRGRGGKGVATSLGVALAITPPVAVTCFVTFAVVFAATRLSSLAALIAVWAFPATAHFAVHLPLAYVILGIAIATLVTIRLRENIGRLLRGKELKA